MHSCVVSYVALSLVVGTAFLFPKSCLEGSGVLNHERDIGYKRWKIGAEERD